MCRSAQPRRTASSASSAAGSTSLKSRVERPAHAERVRSGSGFGHRAVVVAEDLDGALAGLAAVAARDGDLDRAARLYGGGLAQEPTCTAILSRLEREFFAAAHTDGEAERWDAACRQGGALPLHDAIELAFAAPTPTI